uniref:GDP-mannose 4,6-dehydratase n=1 Tax=Cajanus cajan TaxID=3821 RepID=A0A151TIK0_CAJCA|nr:GDP-mannose 4,6 dehydratase 2 [Cajanus cajan]
MEKSGESGSAGANGEAAASRKVALITGITGQDGSYLTELLLEKGYEVHGLIRRSSNFNTQRIDHIYVDPHNAHKARMKLHYADLSDASSLRRWLDTILPHEVYNLAAQSHVAVSFEIPDYTADVVATGALRLLEAVRSHIAASGRSHIRYYQAGSSEMFGATPPPQSESSPFHPRSPYAASKCAAHWYTVNYREAYGLFACNGILFNHESPLAFGYVGLNWRDHVVIDKRYFRPAEVDNLKGDATKAKKVLGWKPKVGFQQLVKMMVDQDVEMAKKEKVLVDAGYIDAQQQP